MSVKAITLVGLSGVGKSTMLSKLGNDTRYLHLQASALIRDEKVADSGSISDSEGLRLGNIDENQQLLVRGFLRAKGKSQDTLVLDGHTLIDTPSGLIEISPLVFEEMGISHFVFLFDAPETIFARRGADTTRIRPSRTVKELSHQQELALLVAFRASLRLNVPLTIISQSHIDTLKSIIKSV